MTMRVLMCLLVTAMLGGCNATLSGYFKPVTDALAKTNPCPSVPVEPSQSYRDCK